MEISVMYTGVWAGFKSSTMTLISTEHICKCLQMSPDGSKSFKIGAGIIYKALQ